MLKCVKYFAIFHSTVVPRSSGLEKGRGDRITRESGLQKGKLRGTGNKQQGRQWRDIQTHAGNNCISGKAISITYTECMFVALGIQHTMRMSILVICGLSGSTIFSRSSHIQHDFRGKVPECKMCVLIFSTNLTETFLNLRRIEWDMIINVISMHVKNPLFWSYFKETWIF